MSLGKKEVFKRPTVPALDEILGEAIPVLDKGFIRVVDYMGDDDAIVQAARVSYGKGTKKKSQDRGLIRYLMRHRHTTPFEMCEIKLHCKLPMFVARQWIRHRTANVNEYSARYSILDNEFYIPEREHLAAQSIENNQGRGQLLEGKEADEVLEILNRTAEEGYNNYIKMLNVDDEGNKIEGSRKGLARELARSNLPINCYTQWYWKIDLHNLLHFIALRADPHSQYEIQSYADVMSDIVRKWMPIAYEAFESYRKFSASFSREAIDVVKRMIDGEEVTQEQSGLSKREWSEVMRVLGE